MYYENTFTVARPPCVEATVRPCCCCPQMNQMMHPDHYEANYVSHCHTENSRWRPNVALPQLTSSATSPKRTPIALKSRKNPTSRGCGKDSIDLFHIQRTRAASEPRPPSRTPVPLRKKNEKREGTEAILEARTTSSSSKVV